MPNNFGKQALVFFVQTIYHNGSKFLDRQMWTNSIDPDHTALEGKVWSGSTMFAILSAPLDALLYSETTVFKF